MVSKYMGASAEGELMQMLDAHDRQTAQEKRQAWQATVDTTEAQANALAQLHSPDRA